jgi:predicted O-methyltransferase YrrM
MRVSTRENPMKELFDQLTNLKHGTPDAVLPGWCDSDKAFTLASLVVATRPDTILEIGVFGGASLIPMALACKALKHGVVIGVDAWSKDVAMAAQTEESSRAWWGALDYDKLYEDLKSKITLFGLGDYAYIVRSKTDDFLCCNSIDLFHCDGDHSEQALKDVERFSPKVRKGGYCVLDDLQWTGNGVIHAEEHLLKTGFRKLYLLGTGAVYLRE